MSRLLSLKLRIGLTEDGLLLAVIYREVGDVITVLDMEVVDSVQEGEDWFSIASDVRPWEHRH